MKERITLEQFGTLNHLQRAKWCNHLELTGYYGTPHLGTDITKMISFLDLQDKLSDGNTISNKKAIDIHLHGKELCDFLWEEVKKHL